MSAHVPRPILSRPRPEGGDTTPGTGGGEGGNRRGAPPRLATLMGPNGLLAAALVLSVVLVALATAALNPA